MAGLIIHPCLQLRVNLQLSVGLSLTYAGLFIHGAQQIPCITTTTERPLGVCTVSITWRFVTFIDV